MDSSLADRKVELTVVMMDASTGILKADLMASHLADLMVYWKVAGLAVLMAKMREL